MIEPYILNGKTGLHNQLQKIHPGTNPDVGIPRFHAGLHRTELITSTHRQNMEEIQRIHTSAQVEKRKLSQPFDKLNVATRSSPPLPHYYIATSKWP